MSERARELERRDLEATEASRLAAERERQRTEAARKEVDAVVAEYVQRMRELETVDVDEENTAVQRLDVLMARAAAESATFPKVSEPEGGPVTLRAAELDALARDERVLVVEDDADIRSAIVSDLREEGYRVREAADGVRAIEKVYTDSQLPDLIILDLGLPYVDGLGVLAVLRSQARTRDLPFLVISAGANIKKMLEGHPDISKDHVFAKPYDPEHMRKAVRERINEWRALPKGPW